MSEYFDYDVALEKKYAHIIYDVRNLSRIVSRQQIMELLEVLGWGLITRQEAAAYIDKNLEYVGLNYLEWCARSTTTKEQIVAEAKTRNPDFQL